MALTRKRVLALPAELENEHRRKSAKELHVGFLPGAPATVGKRRPSSVPFETGIVLPLATGAPAVLPAPVPSPWVKSAPSITAGPSRGTSPVPAPRGTITLTTPPPQHADTGDECPLSLTPTSSSHLETTNCELPSTPLHVPSSAAFMDVAGIQSSPVMPGISTDLAAGETIGSDIDAEDQLADDIGVDYPTMVTPPTLTTNSSTVPPDNFDRLTDAFDQIDRQNDTAIRAILPIDRVVFDWQCDLNGFTGVREEFTGTPGPTFPMSEIESPVNVFLKIWDQEIMSLIENNTNNYAAQYLNKPGITSSSRVSRWHPTSVHELYIFFGLMIQQSLFPATVESEYFYPSSRMTSMPFFKDYISYNRLILLKKFLHFANNDNISDSHSLEERRIYKIKPIMDHLNHKFQNLYLPSQNVAIDESLLKWHGHLSFLQRIPTKAARTGIKSYELCESNTGYLWKFTIYTGKDTTTGRQNRQDLTNRADETDEADRPDRTDLQPAGAAAKIVYDLANPLFQKGYTLIMDNFYNSPLLARSLKLQGTDCYGTLRLNRENVPDSMKSLTKEQLATGDVVSSTSGDLNVIVWKDVNMVSMLSTYHKVEIGATEKYGCWRFKPQVVLDYKKAMRDVDKKDQMLANFPLERTTNSIWYKKVFRRLLNISVQNAFIIYKCKDKSITHRRFRLQVAEGLFKLFFQHSVIPEIPTSVQTIRQLPSTKRGQKPRPVLKNNHFLVKINEHPKVKTCVWCSEQSKRSRSTWQCDICEVALCVECMKPYHTVVRVQSSTVKTQ